MLHSTSALLILPSVGADRRYAVWRGIRTLEDVETDAAQAVDVGVVDLGQEADFWWGHGVVLWKEELKAEDASCLVSVFVPQLISPQALYPLSLFHDLGLGLQRIQRTLIWTLRRPVDSNIEIPQIILMRHRINPRDPISSASPSMNWAGTYASATSLSVSLMILFGSAISVYL